MFDDAYEISLISALFRDVFLVNARDENADGEYLKALQRADKYLTYKLDQLLEEKRGKNK
jgi:hypothetical protein